MPDALRAAAAAYVKLVKQLDTKIDRRVCHHLAFDRLILEATSDAEDSFAPVTMLLETAPSELRHVVLALVRGIATTREQRERKLVGLASPPRL